MVGKWLARQLGVGKGGRKVHVKKGNGSHLHGANFVDNTSFQVFDLVYSPASPTVLRKFSLHAEVLNIGQKDYILGLPWLPANGVLVDTQERCLRNAISGVVIPCAVRWIPAVTVLDWNLEALDNGEIMLIIDGSE